MGLEARCRVSFANQSGDGVVQLEDDTLLFRGPFRLKLERDQMTAIRSQGPDLVVDTASGQARFALGLKAADWAQRLLNPKSRLDKLEVKAGARVVVRGVEDAAFAAELKRRGVKPGQVNARGAADIVFLAAESRTDLNSLATLRAAIMPDGAVWVVSRKGAAATLKDTEIMSAARAVGLVDNKVMSFSATHTALRLVIPKASR